MNIQTNDIGHVIQLAIAPVFLLTGVATKLTVLMNRLARIIDRTRDLQIELRQGPDPECSEELDVLYLRWRLINYAITSSTGCGFLICVVIACLFLGDTANLPLRRALGEAASIRSELMAIAARGPASAGVLVAIDRLKTVQSDGSLSAALSQVEFSIDVLHGISEAAHARLRLLLLQKRLKGMSSD